MIDLPVLDIAAFRSDRQSAGAVQFIADLREALHQIGFAHITGHGVSSELAEGVHSLSRQFFEPGEAERLSIANTSSPHFRGYTRLGHEHTGGRPDWREQIDIGPEGEAVVVRPSDPAWLRLLGPNQWPSSLPAMRPVVTGWMAQMQELGDTAAVLPTVVLPAELADDAGGGQNEDGDDTVHAAFGDNFLKFRLRSHPDVARIHHPDLLEGAGR